MDKIMAAKELKAEMEEGIPPPSFRKGVKDLAIQAAGLPMEPVAGPVWVRALYVLSACGAIGYGAFNVYENWKGPWKQHVTEVAYSVENEIPYPDLYLCLPGRWMKQYTDGTKKMFTYGGSDAALVDQIRKDCGDATAPARVKGVESKTMGTITNTPADTCPFKGAHGITGPYIGCTSDADCVANPPPALDDEAVTARLTALISALPTYHEDGATTPTTTKANCIAFPAKSGAAEKRSDKGQYTPLWQLQASPADLENPIFEGYLAEAGTDPVDADGKIVATPIVFSGFATVAVVGLTVDLIKDEPKGDKRYKPHWRSNLWTKTLFGNVGGQPQLEFDKAVIGFYFESFTVRKILIRNKTWAEIYADLGGIWAASLALLTVFWTKSGHLDKDRLRETYILKYLPVATKKGWLRESAKVSAASRSVTL